MLEQRIVTAPIFVDRKPVPPPEVLPAVELPPVAPLVLPALDVLAGQEALHAAFEQALKRMQRLRNKLPHEPAQTTIYQAKPYTPPPFTAVDILPATKQFLERALATPLLPAPPPFEDVFAPFEPMFHTVFYRRYPYDRLADAKQDALLHLWKQWKKDMNLLEQTAAYVVQCAIWGASPHRKIKKDKVVADRELPMLKYERYIDIRVADQSRDPGWVLASDRRIDIQHAISTLADEVAKDADGRALVEVLNDIVEGRTVQEGMNRSTLSTRAYKRSRQEIKDKLRLALIDYAPQR